MATRTSPERGATERRVCVRARREWAAPGLGLGSTVTGIGWRWEGISGKEVGRTPMTSTWCLTSKGRRCLVHESLVG